MNLKDRNQEIVNRRLSGEQYTSIAKDMNISSTRVRQIVMRERRREYRGLRWDSQEVKRLDEKWGDHGK